MGNYNLKYNRAKQACGCIFTSAVLLIALSSCSAPNKGQETATQTPTFSLTVTAAPVETVTPTTAPTPVPTVTPEPTSVYTFIGQAYCNAKQSVNIRAEASSESVIKGAFPSGEAADVIEYSDKWAHLIFSGIEGYVSREYLLEIYPPSVEIPEGDWTSIVVNPTNKLPGGFEVAVADFKNGQVDKRILKVCEQMFADAKADGVDLKLVDGYRSNDRQNELYQEQVSRWTAKGYSRKDAEDNAATITARPGTSEHQTGLAMDIVTPSYTKMNKGFAKTAAYKWLDTHAYNYGFTLRYKDGKSSVTKVIYEPWHWRFVGIEAAAKMKISGEVLEEYFNVTN